MEGNGELSSSSASGHIIVHEYIFINVSPLYISDVKCNHCKGQMTLHGEHFVHLIKKDVLDRALSCLYCK